MVRVRAVTLWALAWVLFSPSTGSAAPFLAVWLDGQTTNGNPGGPQNGIPFALDQAFGQGSYDLVTNAQLDTPGFLDAYKAVIISRAGNGFGTALSTASVLNIQKYVGAGPNQGGVATFTNDAADSLCNPAVSQCPSSADPFDPNLYQLFINSVTLASSTGHGYIGELNGAIMAFTSNSSGFLPAIGLLPGNSTGVQVVMQKDPDNPVGFIYEEGPIGSGHPIDKGITFPFTTNEVTLFLGYVTSFDSGNVVDQYGDNGLDALGGVPAIVANPAAINGVAPPPSVPLPPTLVLLGLGLAGLTAFTRKRGPRV